MSLDELAIPSDRQGLEEAALAAAENVRDAWVALHMIREALEAKGPVRDAEGLNFLDEADVLIEAIVRSPNTNSGR